MEEVLAKARAKFADSTASAATAPPDQSPVNIENQESARPPAGVPLPPTEAVMEPKSPQKKTSEGHPNEMMPDFHLIPPPPTPSVPQDYAINDTAAPQLFSDPENESDVGNPNDAVPTGAKSTSLLPSPTTQFVPNLVSTVFSLEPLSPPPGFADLPGSSPTEEAPNIVLPPPEAFADDCGFEVSEPGPCLRPPPPLIPIGDVRRDDHNIPIESTAPSPLFRLEPGDPDPTNPALTRSPSFCLPLIGDARAAASPSQKASVADGDPQSPPSDRVKGWQQAIGCLSVKSPTVSPSKRSGLKKPPPTNLSPILPKMRRRCGNCHRVHLPDELPLHLQLQLTVLFGAQVTCDGLGCNPSHNFLSSVVDLDDEDFAEPTQSGSPAQPDRVPEVDAALDIAAARLSPNSRAVDLEQRTSPSTGHSKAPLDGVVVGKTPIENLKNEVSPCRTSDDEQIGDNVFKGSPPQTTKLLSPKSGSHDSNLHVESHAKISILHGGPSAEGLVKKDGGLESHILPWSDIPRPSDLSDEEVSSFVRSTRQSFQDTTCLQLTRSPLAPDDDKVGISSELQTYLEASDDKSDKSALSRSSAALSPPEVPPPASKKPGTTEGGSGCDEEDDQSASSSPPSRISLRQGGSPIPRTKSRRRKVVILDLTDEGHEHGSLVERGESHEQSPVISQLDQGSKEAQAEFGNISEALGPQFEDSFHQSEVESGSTLRMSEEDTYVGQASSPEKMTALPRLPLRQPPNLGPAPSRLCSPRRASTVARQSISLSIQALFTPTKFDSGRLQLSAFEDDSSRGLSDWSVDSTSNDSTGKLVFRRMKRPETDLESPSRMSSALGADGSHHIQSSPTITNYHKKKHPRKKRSPVFTAKTDTDDPVPIPKKKRRNLSPSDSEHQPSCSSQTISRATSSSAAVSSKKRKRCVTGEEFESRDSIEKSHRSRSPRSPASLRSSKKPRKLS